MDRQTVLIPGAGGAAGVGAMRSLRRAGFEGRLVATDADETAAGLYIADEGFVVPRADDDDFLPAARAVIEQAGVDVILPTTGYDLPRYAEIREELAEQGVTAVVSSPEALGTCTDKLAFHDALADDYPFPRTATDPDELDTYPCFVKPVAGKGSRHIKRCETREEAHRAMDTGEPMLVQEYLPGEEYTVDVLSDMDGEPVVAVPRVRMETKGGISFKGRTVLDDEIRSICRGIARDLGLVGPSCMQLKRDAEGTPRLIEVNPRLGGGTVIATHAGVNLPHLTLRLANGETVSPPEPAEIVVSRFWDELVVQPDELTDLER